MDDDGNHGAPGSLSRIEILLSPRPGRHVMMSGLGPAVAPLHITPEDDSTARIHGKEIWTVGGGVQGTGGAKLQLHYIVKWTDMPAASILVRADKILDYVSPRHFEDYEYRLSLERDVAAETLRREQEQEQEQVKRAAQQQTALHQQGAGPSRSTAIPKRAGRRPGRPSKAETLRRKRENGQANIEVLLPSVASPAASGPSLSTPQKPRNVVSDLLTVEEDLGDEDNMVDDGDDDVLLQAHNNGYVINPASSGATRAARPRPSPVTRSPQKSRIAGSGGFTPAARSSGRWPSDSPHKADGSISPSAPAVGGTAGSSRKRRGDGKVKGKAKAKGKEKGKEARGPPPPPAPEEPVYVVESLEDQQYFDIMGEPKLYFLVRWEGNWPPDQNPTWEPSENLPPKLIRRYLRKQSKADVGRYSSVADAFEGDLEEATGEMGFSSESDQDADMEEMLLVEEGE
ncbi:hypothetical protein KJ359_007780 [Pestalotiopsis sp. 9143b]|nr:hypothetical protein KJ359_007780 [Pestalotiopsis sp. 9143b]